MIRPSKLLIQAAAIVAVVAMVGLAVTVVLAQQSAPEPSDDQGILLLRNGNLLCGKITQTGDGYDLLVEGGRIHVKADDVQFHVRTLEQGYRRKRSLIEPCDARAHLELAQWCQRHGLLGAATRELGEARALAPEHPLIPLVERRIEVSLRKPNTSQPLAKPGDLPPSVEELDRLVREMPPGSVERFTQTIQPLLINRCAASGCHGPGSASRFRLLRIPLGRPARRRLTQRNLHATLAWVDRDNPARSKLLTVPIQPHGSVADAVFTDGQLDQYQRIVDWVYQVAENDGPPSPALLEPKQERPATVTPPWLTTSGMPSRSADMSEAVHADAGDVLPLAGSPSKVVPAVPPANPGAVSTRFGGNPRLSSPVLEQGTSLPPSKPLDPFDPEIFNRRFFPEKRSSTPNRPVDCGAGILPAVPKSQARRLHHKVRK